MTEASGPSGRQIREEAERRRRAAEAELGLTRGRAASWAKGVGALLGAGLAFSLIKGRSDLTDLDARCAAAVGVMLLGALGVATIAGYYLFRASFGRLELPASATTDHTLAAHTMQDLRVGLGWAALGTVMLVAAVGVTWYGPSARGPQLLVVDEGGRSVCGEPVRVNGAVLTIKDRDQEVRVNLSKAVQLTPVNSCPPT